ncbi:MAG: DNA methylase [Spirochaetes bacterium ADurb.Bin001]|nr:MAG: DNA methylase [Spirochaetes bacterium ADurb.Bin001]
MRRSLLEEMMIEVLKDISLENLVGFITNELEEIIQYYDFSNGRKGCQKMSLLFNPHRLDVKAKGRPYSVYGALKNEKFIRGLVRAMLFKRGEKARDVHSLLYQAIQMGVNSVQYVNEFPPHIMVGLGKKYIKGKSKDEIKILDPCGGWGGRMIGASVISNNYTCFEPSTKTYFGLVKLAKFIKDKKMNANFTAEIYKMPFEDSDLKECYYDFALTSPPYYDTEEYSKEKTNSMNRYNSFEKWCDFFYFPLIEKTMRALKPEGVFVINIGNRRYPLTEVLFNKFDGVYNIMNIKVRRGLSVGGLNKRKELGEAFYAITRKGVELEDFKNTKIPKFI